MGVTGSVEEPPPMNSSDGRGSGAGGKPVKSRVRSISCSAASMSSGGGNSPTSWPSVATWESVLVSSSLKNPNCS